MIAPQPSNRYALAPMQQGMLFHYLTSGDGGVDIEQIVCTLQESLDLETFRQAWADVAQCHPVFRTRFQWEGLDEPLQEVLDEAELSWTLHDYRNFDSDQQEQHLSAFLREDRHQGFDLSRAPLMRLTCLQMADTHFVIVWTFNHIILDGRSFPIVLNEVFARYEASVKGREYQAKPPRPYEHHIEHLSTQDLSGDEAKRFWTTRLEGFDTPTELPGVETEAIELNAEEDDQGELGLRLSETATTRLMEMSRRHDATMNNFVQGAWALLLSRYTNSSDVLFGAARAGRRSSVEGAQDMVGHFINTVPVRMKLDSQQTVIEWFQDIRADQRDVWKHEQTPLVDIQSWSEVPSGRHLFDTILVFDNFHLNTYLQNQGGAWSNRHFELVEKTNFPLTLYGNVEPEMLLRLAFDRTRFSDETIQRMLQHLVQILDEISRRPEAKLGDLTMLTDEERQLVLVKFNATETAYSRESCIHQLIEQQVKKTPDAIALAFEDRELTYRELNASANQLARHLSARGVGPDVLVGVCLERSVEMMIAILGVLKAGGAYVPLDPAFPKDRVAFMIEDSGTSWLITQESLADELQVGDAEILCLDSDWPTIVREDNSDLASNVSSKHLAYVIYTSGSTGKPKGVMVEHRNVMNFFTGMDQRISPPRSADETPGVWLAVTSLSFDISVLELFYTLARGFKVVLYKEPDRSAPMRHLSAEAASKTIDFSLFYFASDESEKTADKYKLLLEGAKFADENGFVAVSTPERHFHAFGGLFPNPAVAGAALASITKNIQIRAGSVVLPLHHPIRVAEDWSLVDNLSQGRVGISFASGWQPVDFVLRPENYAERHKVMYEGIETVRKLWRGEKVEFPDANGAMQSIGTLPRPVQDELPIWITSAGSADTWRSAGAIGANILTHLLGQSIEEIGEKIAIYKEARAKAGHDPDGGNVTLMLHTFVGDDIEFVKHTVRQPMMDYLASSLSLVKNVVSSWTAFKRRSDGTTAVAPDLDIKSLSKEEMHDLLEFSFERYFETSGLFGTPDSCQDIIDTLKETGIDEIACLIDFGIDSDTVLAHLYHLNKVRKLSIERTASGPAREDSIGKLILEHGVTHLQCTPSMASMILLDDEAKDALTKIDTLMIGGEAFPTSLARDLRASTQANIINMYGPTETTIWSSTEPIQGDETSISIGTPVANTELYILDESLQPLPVGVPGELFIGGDGVVRGYHNRPELTAERFIAHPFRNQANARLYRTGDIARWMADGRMDFLGRCDHQVKLRGYRIELGEIESGLALHESVREAVVIAREDTPGDVRLVAYLVPVENDSIDENELREMLREMLPEYMLPSHYVVLDAYPLTPNRKVDRKALPAPDQSGSESKLEAILPTNDVELTIIEIWKEVLGVASAGIEDNFFDLGGHSLLAVKTHRRLAESFQRTITITDLFRYPTVRALAEFLNDETPGIPGASLQKSEDRAETRREMMAKRRQRRTRQGSTKG
ncbi:MAG: LLM class flavin-dependent oxidoreductase [Planctomycetota bacterium]|nr:LLM class flavin-dependent oxidoreductase [Planctomycetota bacterium]